MKFLLLKYPKQGKITAVNLREIVAINFEAKEFVMIIYFQNEKSIQFEFTKENIDTAKAQYFKLLSIIESNNSVRISQNESSFVVDLFEYSK